MDALIQTLAANPILTLFLVIGLGYLFGEIDFFGFRFGVAGVLFVGLAIGALSASIALPEVVSTLGQIIFVYTIGIHSGPGFFRSFKKSGFRDSALALGVVLFGAALVWVASKLLPLSAAHAAGLFCGALTNTPALAAVRERLGGTVNDPVVAYSLTYPAGVIGVLISFQIFKKLWHVEIAPQAENADILAKDFEVRNPGVFGRTIGEVLGIHKDLGFVISRIQKDGKSDIAKSETILSEGDIVVAVGEEDSMDLAEQIFGEPSREQIELDRSELDYRRVFVSSKEVTGKRIRDLDLQNQYGATITRLKRGDVDLVPSPETRLEFGDRVRVLTRRVNFGVIAQVFGDSIRGTAETDFGSVALGMVLGVLVGMLPIPLPGGESLRLGLAGGPLLMALFLGWLERSGKVTWVIPISANLTLRQIGLLLFLAGVGTKAGYSFASTFGASGPRMMLAGAAITIAVTVATMIFGYKFLKIPFDSLMGMMSGIQTQSACLAYASNMAKSERPDVAYAGVYPVAMIAKILLAQLLLVSLHGAEMPAVNPYLIRPGVNATTGVTGPNVALVSYGYSSDGTQQYMTGFYEYGIGYRTAILVVAPHFTSKAGNAGIGDTSVGLKVKLREAKHRIPAISAYYAYKEPTGTNHMSTGYADQKATLYVDETVGKVRVSANMTTVWNGQAQGYRLQQLPSVGVIAPLHGRFGLAAQTYYSYSTTKYAGVLVVPTVHVSRHMVWFAGVDMKHTRVGMSNCFLTGVTMMHRL